MKREKLLVARKNKGMTQEQIANAAGIQRSYYGLIETGQRNPTLKVATQIAKALDENIEYLFPDDVFFANKCYVMKQTV